ncbi:hypothetical protein HD806DRAFT_428052 [Xylariaceae sp. AK1471]|nr:hypothetical protein HD806DRAFT_428052 [Xylariaceae sp. AK1471]
MASQTSLQNYPWALGGDLICTAVYTGKASLLCLLPRLATFSRHARNSSMGITFWAREGVPHALLLFLVSIKENIKAARPARRNQTGTRRWTPWIKCRNGESMSKYLPSENCICWPKKGQRAEMVGQSFGPLALSSWVC